MTRDQAIKIVGNQADPFVRNMAIALSLHAWLNNAEDWQRLEAACVVLGRKAPRRALNLLKKRKG